MKRELKIGIFLAAAFAILGLFVFIVGDLSRWFKKGGYELNASFQTVTGLEKQAAVRMAGVKIGYVRDIRLANRRAEVVLSIGAEFQVPEGSKASLSSYGMIGEKYVEITPSDRPEHFGPGSTLETTSAVGLDQVGAIAVSVGEEIKTLSRSLNEITGEGSRTDIREALANLNAFTGDLKEFMAANGQNLETGIQGIARASRDLDKQIASLSRNLEETIGTINDIAQENRGAVKTDIEKVGEVLDDLKESARILRQTLEKIDKGEGTVGKLVQDPEMYESAKTTLSSVDRFVGPLSTVRPIGSFRVDYLADSEQAKSVATLGLSLSGAITPSGRSPGTRSSQVHLFRPGRMRWTPWERGPGSSSRASARPSTCSLSTTGSCSASKVMISTATPGPVPLHDPVLARPISASYRRRRRFRPSREPPVLFRARRGSPVKDKTKTVFICQTCGSGRPNGWAAARPAASGAAWSRSPTSPRLPPNTPFRPRRPFSIKTSGNSRNPGSGSGSKNSTRSWAAASSWAPSS